MRNFEKFLSDRKESTDASGKRMTTMLMNVAYSAQIYKPQMTEMVCELFLTYSGSEGFKTTAGIERLIKNHVSTTYEEGTTLHTRLTQWAPTMAKRLHYIMR